MKDRDRDSTAWRERAGEGERPLPLYYRLFSELRAAIFSGQFAEGSMLPGELELCRQYGLSRATVRHALSELVSRGLISREPGRGTKVRNRPTFSPIVANVDGLLERSLILGATTEAEILDFEEVPAPAQVAEILRLKDRRACMIVLLRRLDGEPFVHFTSWVPISLGRSFDRDDLVRGSALSLLDHGNLVIRQIQQTIAAEPAGRSVATHLQVNPGTPLLRIERVVYANDGTPVEWSVALYRHDRHQYRLNLIAPEPHAMNGASESTPTEKTKRDRRGRPGKRRPSASGAARQSV